MFGAQLGPRSHDKLRYPGNDLSRRVAGKERNLRHSLRGRRRRGGRREKNERAKCVSLRERDGRASLRPFPPLVRPATQATESSAGGTLVTQIIRLHFNSQRAKTREQETMVLI